MAKKRFRTDRLFIIILILIIIIIFPVDSVRRFIYRFNEEYDTDSAIVLRIDESTSENIQVSGKKEEEIKENKRNGFEEISVDSSQLFYGELVKVDNENPYVYSGMPYAVDLINYRNDYYTLINETDSVILNIQAADALNMMMKDYYDVTGQANFLVYGTTDTYTGEDSYCPQYFPESSTGNTIDLAVNVGSDVLTYDGCDEEKWIIDHCHEYGYILRFPLGKREKTGKDFYPWHLRYVGKVHASVMKDLDYCLEEYLDILDTYTFDNPLSYRFGGSMYKIYSVRYTGEITSVPVPDSGEYTISGNNTDSFIITSVKF
ncbi:MAG: D-alanyl-D-alanine carboxypeptidase family protein [Ruminococcus sp.]|nr:D-alanyl-D-alanine carboxypeptidase family protein [Ruminococcus sp.]